MKNNEKNIRLLVRRIMSEMENVNESDLLVAAGLDWNRVKPELLNTVKTLIQKIDDDKYSDAEDLIGKAIVMLRIWRHKIHKGKGMVHKTANAVTIDETGTQAL